MAEFKGMARTNFFRVRRRKWDAFAAWAKRMELEVCKNNTDRTGRSVCLLAHSGDGWPCFDPGAMTDQMETTTFSEQIWEFLEPGHVAIMVEAGHEKMTFVGGHAVAVDHKGNEVSLQLSDIEDMARKKWPKAKITAPAYGG